MIYLNYSYFDLLIKNIRLLLKLVIQINVKLKIKKHGNCIQSVAIGTDKRKIAQLRTISKKILYLA